MKEEGGIVIKGEQLEILMVIELFGNLKVVNIWTHICDKTAQNLNTHTRVKSEKSDQHWCIIVLWDFTIGNTG